MLMLIDNTFKNIPSVIINVITLGSRGSSLCGRLYLYRRYISKKNVVVNFLIAIIDSIEKDHCKIAARYWRVRAKKHGCFFPKRYSEYLK